MPVPNWLAQVTPDSMQDDPFPLRKVLRDSLYYPASGFDGAPVKYLAGCVFSFVYVDYGYRREELESELTKSKELTGPGFKGYVRIGRRSVTEDKLISSDRRHPRPLSRRPRPLAYTFDGRPISKCSIGERPITPFCEWAVFQRDSNFSRDHGPSRFSWLYLCAEGVQVFHELYRANGMVPKAVAVIQPGHGTGGNWTNFEDPDGCFAKCVLANPYGRPEILLYGGYGDCNDYRASTWPGYQKPGAREVKSIQSEAGRGLRNSLGEDGTLIVNLIRQGESDKYMGVWFNESNGGHP